MPPSRGVRFRDVWPLPHGGGRRGYDAPDPLYADNRNFYKVEKWTMDGSKVDWMIYAGNAGVGRVAAAMKGPSTTEKPSSHVKTGRTGERPGLSLSSRIVRSLFSPVNFPKSTTAR